MTLTIELPKELETDLIQEAEQAGLSLADYTLFILRSRVLHVTAPQNGAELVAYWQNAGLLGTNAPIQDVPAHARNLRTQAERRRKIEQE